LTISATWLQAFRAAIQEAASATARDLHRSGAFPWDLRVSRAALCRLGEFPAKAVFCDEEMMASVLVSHRGWILGTSVISLEPKHALELIRSVEGDPLDVFRSMGARLLRGVLERLGAGEGQCLECGDPGLEEDSLVATILGTHAPRETTVVSLQIDFVSARRAFPAYLYLLLDSKTLESALGSL
jgi:hypothetical protein